MASKQVEIGSGSSPEPVERNYRVSLIVLIIAILAMSPVFYEGVLICYSHWMEAFDKPVDVRTPILDCISTGIESARHDAWGDIRSYFDHATWEPTSVLLGAVVVMAIAAKMLKL
jgi:hypothetical protein